MKKTLHVLLHITTLILPFALGLFLLLIALLIPNGGKKITNINRLEKEVTITDSGIADAVEKVYDATVVVITSKNSTPIGSGSGFVYKKDNNYAYIITNNHVVQSGDSYSIELSDNSVYKATLVGTDPYVDIAVLKVSKDQVTNIAILGSTESMRVGDTVFAVGAPLSYETFSFTVTRGILSGKNRAVEVSLSQNNHTDWVMSVLQTDTPINSGNSGGPLCNSNGEVIGVTNMKLAKSGVEGMGFAITIEDAKESADLIISGKTKEYPVIGISTYNASQVYMGYITGYETTETSGVYVVDVDANGAAKNAGMQSGDVIVKLNDKTITNVATFKYELFKHKVGENITISVKRNGELKNLKVKLSK